MRDRLWIGTSGYQYPHWKGRFYPEDMPGGEWFAHYARHFDCVEINNTFYRLPRARVFDGWREAAPRGFRYALKYSRYGSHMKRLKDPRLHVPKFMTRARRLKGLLGPVLVQLPPRFEADAQRLERFLAAVPRGPQWVLEFRDPSWLCEEIYRVLEHRGAALCIHDLLPDHPRRITTGCVYLRFHGERYGGSYSHQFLGAQARRIRGWLAAGLEVYAFFNNDRGGHAVHNALDLKRYLGAA
ncbi:MAG: DUF72 domain-containing protein [Burkholderiales bacterium]|nr:DUF72 domain-containing protein [Burkholderiales bacterium]